MAAESGDQSSRFLRGLHPLAADEAEHAELDYTSPGVDVLLHAVVARANR